MSPYLILTLVVLCLLAGIGITTVGPGGVLATAALFLLTDLPPATVAGTAIITQIATGLLASGAYYRSGHLRDPVTKRIAVTLSATAVVGTPIGVLVNMVLPTRVFGALLASFLLLIAFLVHRRGRLNHPEENRHHPTRILVTGGLLVSAASAMFGVGGPLLTVPLLVAIGTPMLPALAAAQLQSVIIATVGTLGYATQNAIDWPLAAVIGIPQLVGVTLGWRIARRANPTTLKRAMIATLVAVAPFLLLRA